MLHIVHPKRRQAKSFYAFLFAKEMQLAKSNKLLENRKIIFSNLL
jgi:hypothetical protein